MHSVTTADPQRHHRSKAPDLFKVREFNIRNRQPITVIVFKLYSEKTPIEICKLLGGIGNNLPWDLWGGVKTRVDYNYEDHKVDCSECLVFFEVTGGDLPDRVEIPNVLTLYRKGVDGKKFHDLMYKEVFRLDGK